MPKNAHSKSSRSGWDTPMTLAMKLFLAGCFAELYLILIRRFYIMGNLHQVVAWSEWLPRFAIIGLVVAVAGLALVLTWKALPKKREIAAWVLGGGAFLAVSSFLVSWRMSLLTFLLVIVPVLMVLIVLWCLYDRECSTSLTILALSLTMLWVIRRVVFSMYVGRYVKIAAVVYLLVLAAYALYVRKVDASRSSNAKSEKAIALWSAKDDPLPVYIACVVSVAAVAISLVGSLASYYATWGLAAVAFVLAVYYTVKQL